MARKKSAVNGAADGNGAVKTPGLPGGKTLSSRLVIPPPEPEQVMAARARRGRPSNPQQGDDEARRRSGEFLERHITITRPNMEVVAVKIIGDVPYLQNRFPEKAIEAMKEKQRLGSQAKKGGKREPKDFNLCYEQAKHVANEGWLGIPCAAFRQAMVDACRTVGFKMTLAKLGVFIIADGFDRVDRMPLVRIITGDPHYVEHAVRNDSGVADIRPRPCWDPGWEAIVRIRFDADMFMAEDVVNLLYRVGVQVGVGEGRPSSKNSCGMGWGTFELALDN